MLNCMKTDEIYKPIITIRRVSNWDGYKNCNSIRFRLKKSSKTDYHFSSYHSQSLISKCFEAIYADFKILTNQYMIYNSVINEKIGDLVKFLNKYKITLVYKSWRLCGLSFQDKTLMRSFLLKYSDQLSTISQYIMK